MHRYSVDVGGKTIRFRAKSQREAVSIAFGISKRYSDLKRLESRWWLLIFPLVFVVGYLFMLKLGG